MSHEQPNTLGNTKFGMGLAYRSETNPDSPDAWNEKLPMVVWNTFSPEYRLKLLSRHPPVAVMWSDVLQHYRDHRDGKQLPPRDFHYAIVDPIDVTAATVPRTPAARLLVMAQLYDGYKNGQTAFISHQLEMVSEADLPDLDAAIGFVILRSILEQQGKVPADTPSPLPPRIDALLKQQVIKTGLGRR
jgi:hypothetical protein